MRSRVPYIVRLGLGGALLVAACQAPDAYFWGPDAGGGIDGPSPSGRGGSTTGTGGMPTGLGGMPTGLGGTTGTAGSTSTAGTTGSAGSVGSAGSGGSPAGTGGTPAGAAGTTGMAGRGGTTGNAGTTGAAGRGGTTGNAGSTGTAGRGGTTGDAGTTGSAGRGGTTGNAGTTGAAGRGGTTGNAGTTGTAGGTGTVLFSDDFENETVGVIDEPSGWTREGGSNGDWSIATDGSRVLQQNGATSSTLRIQSATGASGWSGAVSASARVKILGNGNNNQVALVCVRVMGPSNRYCGALTPTGVQIQTAVGGSLGSSAIFTTTVTTGMFYDLRISVDAANTLTVYLNGGAPRGTYTATALASGTVAVGTNSMTAAFDNVTVTRP